MRLLFLFAALFAGSLALSEVLYFDTFDTPESLKRYNHWSPAASGGRFDFDAKEGKSKPGCGYFSVSMRAALSYRLRKLDPAGGIYRFSCYTKSDTPGMGTFTVKMYPSINRKGEVIPLSSSSTPVLVTKDWTYQETYLRIPPQGKYNLGQGIGFMVQAVLQNFSGKLFIDDYKVEKVASYGIWGENFTDKSTAASWGLSGRSNGIEGTAEMKYIDSGFSDPGAWQITWKSGKSGYGVAPKKPLQVKDFGNGDFALDAAIASTAGAAAVMVVDVYDAAGKVIKSFSGEPVAVNNDYKIVSLPFTLDKDAVSFSPVITNSGKGIVKFDNVVIRKASEAEKTLLERNRKAPLWSIVYPFDFYSYIDREEPNIKLLAGRTSYIKLMLAGDKTLKGDTVIDLTLPEELEVLSAQFSTYGPEIPFQQLRKSEAGTKRYRFVNPYNWARYMMRNNPNHYTGLQIIVRAADKVGKVAPLKTDMRIGSVQGEQRTLAVELVKPEPEAVYMPEFRIGGWGGGSVLVRNAEARKELISSIVKSGITFGSVHESQYNLTEDAKKLGFMPGILIHSPDYVNIYKGQGMTDLPMRTLNDGRTDKGHIALGAALNDPKFQAAYKKHIKKALSLLPKTGHCIVEIDIEFWGTGQSHISCFHPSTIAEFRKWAKIGDDVKLDSKIILKSYFNQWSKFRRAYTVRMHKYVKELVHELRKDCEFVAYDYTLNLDGSEPAFARTVPTVAMDYDKGDAIDAHQVSYYNYEGVVFLDHADNDAKKFSKPVWGVPYICEALPSVQQPGWSYHHPCKEEVRMEVLGAAASGLKGFAYFTGKAYDASRLNAINSGLNAVARYKDYYFKGKRADEKVKLNGMTKDMRYRVHEYKGKKLVTIFNCGKTDQTVTLPGGRKVTVKTMDFVQEITK